MRRAPLALLAILAVVVLQVTVLNNLPFPGGSAPDLALVAVVAMALASGPLDGALLGFAAGLALDVAPPASGMVGQGALVFCLAGYGCGRLRGTLERSPWLPLAGVALGAAAGEALYALVGLIFGDPDITWRAVREVLPVTVGYDLLLSPFVLYAVAWLGGYARWGARAVPSGLLTSRELAAAGAGPASASGAVRDTGTGRSPRLKAAARGADGWIGRGREQAGQRAGAPAARRRLRLRLSGGVAGSAAPGGGGPASPARSLPVVHLRLAAPRRRDGAIAPRRGTAGARAAFGDGRAAGGAARLRGGALAGGPSALTQAGRGAGPRQARLKLGSKGRRTALTGGGALGGLIRRLGRAGRRRRMGKGAFAGAPTARTGTARSGAGRTAAPRFRRSASLPRGAAPRVPTAAPKFRRSASLARGGAARLPTAPRFRRRFSGAGRGGWR